MFLLSPVVLWVLLGLRVLPCPCVRGFSYQGVLVLFLRSVSIWPPSFPAPLVSYGLVVVSPGWSPPLWLFSFTRPTFVHCGLVICCLSPVCLPHLGRGYVVSSVFISYAVCLCRLCSWCLRDGVTLAWVECRCCFLPSIGTKATFLSVLSIPSGWGHPLGQVCFLFPLISIEGSLSFWSVPSAGLPGPVPVLATCSLGGLHRWPLCSSSLCGFIMICQFSFSWYRPYLDLLAFFATVSSLAILASCCSLLPRSFSSSRVSFAVWLVLLLGALCLPPFCTFSSFVFFCLQRFFLLYRLPVLFLVLPLSLWFRSCSSPA